MKQLFFGMIFLGTLGACTAPQESKKDEGKEISKDTLKQKVEESKDKTEESSEPTEVKETEETVREEP